MKNYFIILSMIYSTLANTQTTAEWTQQKKTQIQYLLEQIGANTIYIDHIEKGYKIARKGLNTIQNIKNGDLSLHRDHFRSLEIVNPKIKSYTRVADIIAYQVRIAKKISITIKNLKASRQFSTGELDHCKTAFENLLDECLKTIDELYLVLTSTELQMTDDERIKRIDDLYTGMQENYSFCQSFIEECSLLAVHRAGEKVEIEFSKKLNSVK